MEMMNRCTRGCTRVSVAAAMLLLLGACSGMSAQDRSTAIGAGAGTVVTVMPAAIAAATSR